MSACRRIGVWRTTGDSQRSQRSEKVTKVLKGFEYTRNWILPVSGPSRVSFVPFSDLRVDLLYVDTPTRFPGGVDNRLLTR